MARNIPVPTYDYTLRLHQRARQSRTGPGQQRARKIQDMVAHLPHQYQSAEITWVKGHAGTPGNDRVDALAGMAAGRTSWSPFTSLAHLKLRISEKFQKSKKEWDRDPHHHGTGEIPPPPPPPPKKKKRKKSHAWIRPGMPWLGQPPRLGPVTGAPRCISKESGKGGMTNVGFAKGEHK
jgi:hypothetical protein